MVNHGRIPGFLKGVGVNRGGGVSSCVRIQDFSQAPPPLGHCPRESSSALRKLHENIIHSGYFTSTPVEGIGHCPCDIIHIPRGGVHNVDQSLSNTHPCSIRATGHP